MCAQYIHIYVLLIYINLILNAWNWGRIFYDDGFFYITYFLPQKKILFFTAKTSSMYIPMSRDTFRIEIKGRKFHQEKNQHKIAIKKKEPNSFDIKMQT